MLLRTDPADWQLAIGTVLFMLIKIYQITGRKSMVLGRLYRSGYCKRTGVLFLFSLTI